MCESKKKTPKKECIWMLVTSDEYELPVIVADTSVELAKKAGVTKYAIYRSIRCAKKRGGFSKFVKVEC